jgi:hypothetical protein
MDSCENGGMALAAITIPTALHLSMIGVGFAVLAAIFTFAQRMGNWHSKPVGLVLGVIGACLAPFWVYIVSLWVFQIDLLAKVVTVSVSAALVVVALVAIGLRKKWYRGKERKGHSDDLSPLAFASYEPLRGGRVFMHVPWNFLDITAVYIKNTQVAPVRVLRNVRARVEYLHNGVPDFVVERACWWAHCSGGISNSDTIDLEGNEEQAMPLLMVSTAKEGTADAHKLKLPQSAAFNGWTTRNLGLGKWTLRITVSANFCESLKGEIEFTVLSNPSLGTISIGTQSPLGSVRLPVENPVW